ncbi:glycerol-3-phosphate dehydrogenase [Veronia pacifica]|uniref:Glycerol-3-phosphate dehydrogenase n=1 Tax=Veronia pacifica TaxID=1080227 RepID=A0A1C3EBQ5_9GAMM|nr:glycerol-3-phosphate dehydrogenase [Veronia pacifica]ODA30665.1 glycerol-3-phosphate dehydrogenase [Veronia pacifica]
MDSKLQQNDTRILDMIIIGGGINGAGIAADASGRGLSVGLFEANDFASATSSASSKLIHGGLRYLEHYEFRLVSEALKEREVLLKKAPHIVEPMRFRLPHRPFLRPAWMIRCGLFLYDFLGKRKTLPASHSVDLAISGILKSEMKVGFEYSDCWVDDARLVLLNVQATKANGGEVRNYCKVDNAVQENGIWAVSVVDQLTGMTFERKAKALVNAAGPWVKTFYDESLDGTSPRNIRLIKGSHIVVPKIHDEEQAYILQNKDGRIVFVIPYMDDFSLIGTTDVEHKGDPRDVAISEEEVDYLLDITNQHFVKQIGRDDVVWTYSGVRPLCDDESDSPQAITRDYTLELDHQADGDAPLLSIFGGKLTTYRKLAESALDKLSPFFPDMGDKWTVEASLPGGEFSCSRKQFSHSLRQQHVWMDQRFADRLARQYGTNCHKLLDGVISMDQLGYCFGDNLYQCEVDYLIDHEFVKTVDDLVWRRTKMGLYLTDEQKTELSGYVMGKQPHRKVIRLDMTKAS